MRIRFWGVRSTIPLPLSPFQYRSRIQKILQRAGQANLNPANLSDFEIWQTFQQALKGLPSDSTRTYLAREGLCLRVGSI